MTVLRDEEEEEALLMADDPVLRRSEDEDIQISRARTSSLIQTN